MTAPLPSNAAPDGACSSHFGPGVKPSGTENVETFGIRFSALRHKSFPDIKWIVPEILPEGCSILAARPKLGKSWLALDIGAAVARGDCALGDKLCALGDVLYLALEDNERRLQSRGFKLLGGGEWPERLAVATDWPRADQGGISKIERWANSVSDPRLVVVDVLAAFRAQAADSKSTYTNDYNAVAELRDLANRLGIAVLIIHHTRKGTANDPADTISGTLGLSGAADASFILDRTAEKGTTLYARGRDIREMDVALDWSHELCRWSIKGPTDEVTRSDQRSDIIAAIQEHSVPLAPKQIAEETGMAGANVRQLLKKMVRDGEVARHERGKYWLPGHKGGRDHTDHTGHAFHVSSDESFDSDTDYEHEESGHD